MWETWLNGWWDLLHAVTDRSTDDTDGECESCDGGDKVIGANDGRCSRI
jgi:hypothetical protein